MHYHAAFAGLCRQASQFGSACIRIAPFDVVFLPMSLSLSGKQLARISHAVFSPLADDKFRFGRTQRRPQQIWGDWLATLPVNSISWPSVGTRVRPIDWSTWSCRCDDRLFSCPCSRPHHGAWTNAENLFILPGSPVYFIDDPYKN